MVTNQQEEMTYFNAHFLPVSQKANIQTALDTYGAVRLDRGDYSGVNVTMRTNNKLFGHPSLLTIVSHINIEAGSSGVVLTDLFPTDKNITFLPGAPITNCTFKTIKWATLVINANAKVENCSFINYGGTIKINNSVSGYFRNNKIIKHQSGTVSNLLVLKGNSTTPSYGNTFLHSNYLTPHGDTTDIDNLPNLNMVGIDAEGWNLTNDGTKAMFTAKNMGEVKLSDFGGGNHYSAVRTPAFDVDAANFSILGKHVELPTDVLSPRTNMIAINGSGTYTRSAGTVTGFDLLGNIGNSKTMLYNGVEQTSTIANSTIVNNLKASLLGTQRTPWPRPTWETLPDPLGPNWKTERVGKTDQKNYIQNLINTNGIAELPEGIFYIGSTLTVPIDRLHGIVGKGTGKTAIVALTDDFPIITLTGGQDDNFYLAYLTLQGGSVGVYSSRDLGRQHMSFQNMKFVVFRNQNYGIQLKRMIGFDNNFIENVAFVDCNIGFFQDPLLPWNNDSDTSSFVDKTMFYKNQFINCGTAVSMMATRADNLNAWVDSKFDGGQVALKLTGNNSPIVANSEFSNYRGEYVIETNAISIYSSKMYNNAITKSTITAINTNIEGSQFLDNSPLFSAVMYNTPENHIANSVITGNVSVVVPATGAYFPESSTYMNSTLLSNPSLSKILTQVKSGNATVLINQTPTPYPQLLVTQ